jgi:hypothetical protein
VVVTLPPLKVVASLSVTEPAEMLLSTVKLPVPLAVKAPVPLTGPFKVANPLLAKVRL